VGGLPDASGAEFYLLAVLVGLVQGGVQALSRSLFARLIPADKAAEFFGFYNIWANSRPSSAAADGRRGAGHGNPRLGILAIIILFVAGGALLLRVELVPREPGRAETGGRKLTVRRAAGPRRQ